MKNIWQGNLPLVKTFWLIYVIGSLLIPLIISAIIFLGLPLFGIAPYQLSIAVFFILIMFNPYYIFCWVSVWRSSSKSENMAANYLSKTVVLAHVVYVISGLFVLKDLLKNGI